MDNSRAIALILVVLRKLVNHVFESGPDKDAMMNMLLTEMRDRRPEVDAYQSEYQYQVNR